MGPPRCWRIVGWIAEPTIATERFAELTELTASVERDPARVASEVTALADRYRSNGDHAGVSRALAILGRSRRLLGEIDLAASALHAAIAAAQQVGDTEAEADAHLALAGVLALGSTMAAAFAHLDDVERLGSEAMQEAARLQRAVLCTRSGRIDEALAMFAEAIPRLRQRGATIDLARVLANRGGIYVRRGELRQAVADFDEAYHLFSDAGQEFVALQVRHNLGWAAANLGQLPQALAILDENCQAFLRLGHDASLPLVSRAEVLLSAGLSADALELADEALRRLGAEGDRATAAEAWLLRAQAARLDGDAAGAAEAAEQARATFAAMGSMGRRLAAELEVMQARRAIDARQLGMSELLRLEALAGELAAVGNASGQVAALSLATAVAADLRQIDVARRCAAAAAARAEQVGLLETRLNARYASAMAAWAVGDGVTARRYLNAAFDGLARDRMTLGASDARAAIEVHARDVVDLAMRVALDDPRPWNLLTWMERARAGTALPRPAVPAVPSVVVDELAELRSVALELTRAELDGSPSDELRSRQAGLERSLHDRWLRESRPDEAAPSTRMLLGELRERLAGRGLVSVAGVGGELVAVVITARRSAIVGLGPIAAMRQAAERATAAFRGLVATRTRGAGVAVEASRRRAAREAVDELERRLVEPLALACHDVVMVVPADLHAVPWRALPSLRGRAVTLAPSVRWWLDASRSKSGQSKSGQSKSGQSRSGQSRSGQSKSGQSKSGREANGRRPGKVLVAAGPRLEMADAEAAAVAACHPGARLLAGESATTRAVVDGLDDAPLAHIVAHGRFRHDNPLWSTIELSDGPLSVYELELLDHTPPVMVLASCDSGVGGPRGGDQLLGLSQTLLRMGTLSIVASVNLVPDDPTTTTALVALHEDLARGVEPSASLAGRVYDDPLDDLAAACFVTLGVS
jgi:tetratricopeptide (TPR) repeat protein